MAARTRSRFDEPGPTRPASDAYTGLLALSLLAMIASCVILYLDYAQYGNTKAPGVNIPTPPAKNPNINQGNPAATMIPSMPKDLVQAPAPIMPASAIKPAPAPVMPEPTAPSLLPPAMDAPPLPLPIAPQN